MEAAARFESQLHPGIVNRPLEFQELYERYSQAVYRTALRVTGSQADAEDVLQTVFLRLFDQRLTLDPMWSPEAYLRRAAANASIDMLRRRKSRAEVAIEDQKSISGKSSTALLKERLRRAMANLPPEDAEVFALCYLEGYSYDELAELYQVERGTIGSRLHRIRVILKRDLSE